MKHTLKTLVILSATSLCAGNALAEKQEINTTTQSFAVKLGATRVIYNPASSGATVSIENPQDYPMLVQSKVLEEDKTTTSSFVVTPPLFRLDGKQQSRVRVVRTGGEMPADKEQLNWLCITGIPPKADDAWAQDGKGKKPDRVSLNVQMSISSCIKLLVRPSSVKGEPSESAGSMTWSHEAGKLVAKNPTPFYQSLNELMVGGKPVKNLDYVPPFGQRSFEIPAGAAGEVQWSVVTDFGGKSRAFTASLK
ncbi:TPA: fimbria/pilus periplasmic chaperone [Serratia fonticola]|nr:fimbria/pilus periplasmic chaperone [Serratia fonticola]